MRAEYWRSEALNIESALSRLGDRSKFGPSKKGTNQAEGRSNEEAVPLPRSKGWDDVCGM
jgi:hypothetical protein